jgi:hypothetical protein
VVSVLLISCTNGNNGEQINILSFIKTSKIDSSFFLRDRLLASTSRSLDAQHYAFSCYHGEYITTFLNQGGDSIIVYNGKAVLGIKIPFKFKVPISSLYFHNYDSIFVFLDREFVSMYSTDTFRIDDFILINSEGKLIDTYSLNGFPYIYNGQLNPMVYLKKTFVKNRRFKNGYLYLPFSIYLPRISDKKIRNLELSLLCKYDLHSHVFCPLKIDILEEDIGIQYSENVAANSIDFYLLNDNTIIYAYDYSPKIYGYNLLKDSAYLVFEARDFPFCNDSINPNNHFSVLFSCPVYNRKYKKFTRLVKVKGYKDYQDFEFTQIFDSSFISLGYVFSDSGMTSINTNAQEEFIVSDKTDKYLSYLINLGKTSRKTLPEIESDFFVLKHSNKRVRDNRKIFNKSYEERLLEYIKSLNLKDAEKIVLINTDILCSHCIDYLMGKLKENADLFVKQRIKYVFYGDNLRFAEEIMKDYQIASFDLVFIDSKNSYISFIKPEEYSKNPLIIQKHSSLKLFLYEPEKINEVFTEFMDY